MAGEASGSVFVREEDGGGGAVGLGDDPEDAAARAVAAEDSGARAERPLVGSAVVVAQRAPVARLVPREEGGQIEAVLLGEGQRARRGEDAPERERDAVDDAGLGEVGRVADAVAHLARLHSLDAHARDGVRLGVADAAGAAAEGTGGPRAGTREHRRASLGAVAGVRRERAGGVAGGLL